MFYSVFKVQCPSSRAWLRVAYLFRLLFPVVILYYLNRQSSNGIGCGPRRLALSHAYSLSLQARVLASLALSVKRGIGCGPRRLVGSSGLEPPTSRLSGARSSLLSYEPVPVVLCSLIGFAFRSSFQRGYFRPLRCPSSAVSAAAPNHLAVLLRCRLHSGTYSLLKMTAATRYRLRRPAAGGDEEIRTLDPLLAGQVLSQLSYTPGLVFSRSLSGLENRTTKSDVSAYSSPCLFFRAV